MPARSVGFRRTRPAAFHAIRRSYRNELGAFTVRLETENGGTFQDPTDVEIIAALSQLDGYAILSHNEMTYMQAAGTSQYSFVLEYQEGDTQEHFVCPDRLSLNDTTTAFIAYARENPRWRSAFRWEKLGHKSAAGIDSQLAREVSRQKKMTIAHNARVNWTLGASSIAGVVVGVGAWFLPEPRDRDGGLAFLLGVVTFTFAVLLCFFLFPRPAPKCPQCGYVWEKEGDRDWLRWKCCPGCGLKMSYGTGWHEKP